MPTARLIGVLLFSSVAAVAAVGQQAPGEVPPTRQQPPVFRGGTETVAVYATVLDRYGEMVRGLTRDDFEVYDDGQLQTLTNFEAGLQPITATLMIDTSASMTLNLELALAAAEQFVIRMLPEDKVRVGSFSDRVDLSPEFTSDRDALLRSLREDLHIGNPTKLWDAVEQSIAALAPFGGRRVLMLMTDGMDTASTATPGGLLARARIAEVMVYVVQFRSNPRANLAEFPLAPSASQVFGGDSQRRARAAPDLVSRLARQSGGGFFLLGQYDDVNATFGQVMAELHYQYVLGFTPSRADGRIHTLDVRVRKPNLAVRARQAYLAASPTTELP